MSKKEEVIDIVPVKQTRIQLEIIGDAPLILCKKSESFTQQQIFKQTHPDGTPLPDRLNPRLNYNLWEKLITSITWENDIPILEDFNDYTEEMYRELLETNKPCILSKAFISSFYEAFVSFYRTSSKKNGTDFTRSVHVEDWKNPITFTNASYEQTLVPNSGRDRTNVIAQRNIFYGWRCNISIKFCKSVIPQKTVLEIINTAGEFVGIGTKRKEGFGNYHIGEIKVFE